MHPKSKSGDFDSLRVKRNLMYTSPVGYESTSDFWRNEAQKKVKVKSFALNFVDLF